MAVNVTIGASGPTVSVDIGGGATNSMGAPLYSRGPAGEDGLDGVQSSDSSVTDILAMTQAEYNALDPVSATTFYIITD